MTTNAKNLVSELLPCPFCGSSSFIFLRVDSNNYAVICQYTTSHGCGMRGPYGKSRKEARIRWNTRAAAKVIESALARDSERLDKLEELAGEAYVGMCFEMDGGVHMTIEAPSSVPVVYRNKNNIRDALDAAIREKNKFVPILIEHEPDCNIRMDSVERQMMGCDCKLSENRWKFITAKLK